jgi:hypothetical protein
MEMWRKDGMALERTYMAHTETDGDDHVHRVSKRFTRFLACLMTDVHHKDL